MYFKNLQLKKRAKEHFKVVCKRLVCLINDVRVDEQLKEVIILTQKRTRRRRAWELNSQPSCCYTLGLSFSLMLFICYFQREQLEVDNSVSRQKHTWKGPLVMPLL